MFRYVPVARNDAERWVPPDSLTEGELHSPTGVNQPCGQLHHFLHDGMDPSAVGAVTQRGIRTTQAVPRDPARHVVGQSGTSEDQGGGGKLVRGQTLDLVVGLQPDVVLLGGSVAGI